jgi:hypothetical protein
MLLAGYEIDSQIHQCFRGSLDESLGISRLLNVDTSDQEIATQVGADIIEGKELVVVNNSPGGVGGSRHLALRVSSCA